MKVEVIEAFKFPTEIIFTRLSDIPQYVDWSAGIIKLISLIDNPAGLGTRWEHVSDLLGEKACHIERVQS